MTHRARYGAALRRDFRAPIADGEDERVLPHRFSGRFPKRDRRRSDRQDLETRGAAHRRDRLDAPLRGGHQDDGFGIDGMGIPGKVVRQLTGFGREFRFSAKTEHGNEGVGIGGGNFLLPQEKPARRNADDGGFGRETTIAEKLPQRVSKFAQTFGRERGRIDELGEPLHERARSQDQFRRHQRILADRKTKDFF